MNFLTHWLAPATNSASSFQELLQQGHCLPQISLAEVADHDTHDDCWIVIYDRVYDVTRFLRAHPGGDDVIMDHAGRDATLAFRGTGHSNDAIQQMNDFLIGELPAHEHLFRKSKIILSSSIPD